MSLPDEVLALFFSPLGTKDLLQCQLTSRQWHKVSLRPLYSHLLGDEERAHKYVRTISHFPQLGKYLTNLYITDPFEPDAQYKDTGLLDTIIEYCPNITTMDGAVYDTRFWPRLMYAGNQGQLPYLESLPRPISIMQKIYINTSLAFKNTLTTLWISNRELYSQLADSDTDGAMYNQIDQFKNLTTIYLECYSSKYLSYYDKLIDKCHSLKTLIFTVQNIREIQQSDEPGPTILPRLDMWTIECCWGQINVKSQLEYLMRKFPNLQSLTVEPWRDGSGLSGPTLVKFIQYILSIPDFELDIEIDKKEILNVWAEFAKAKNGCKCVTLSYLEYHPSSAMYQLELSDEQGLGLGVKLHPGADELPHIQFLSEVGKSIQSLKITDASLFQHINDKPSTIAWLLDILQLCPLLEELTICNPTPSSPIHQTLQYPSLKIITIDKLKNIQSISFLHYLSLSFPNLCRLSLSFDHKSMEPITINMPHTSFDLLVWKEKAYYLTSFKGYEFYIKLNTEKGLEYYLGKRKILVPISESRYLLSPKYLQFDICCKHLKELRMTSVLPNSDSNFVFKP